MLSKERTIIKKQFIYSIFLICLSMPLGAIAQSLEAISGPTHGKSGDTLTFVVEARDSDGNPQSGVKVLFGISPSDDTSDLGTYSTTTRVGGRAKTTLILENNATGIYRISAWRTDNNFTAIFNVTIDAAPLPRSITATTTTPLPEPPTLSIVSGDGQEGVAGTVLADPFVVELRDENGKPLRRITVTFTITAGRGAMSVVTSTTDSDGRVASLLTLSSEPGINRVQVSAEGLSQTVIFNAEGTVPPSEPMPSEEEMTTPMPESMVGQDIETPISTPEPATSLEFDLSLPSGFNLIHIPLKVRALDGMAQTIESVADLYAALGGANNLNWLITHDSQTQTWHGYFGDADRGTAADKVLTDQTGILADVKTPISVHLAGDALGENGMSAITLTPGLNLVGLPLRDPRLTRVSDLFTLQGIGGNIAVVILTDNGEFKLVGRAGDPGDIPITGGGAFILIASDAGTIPITGTGWDNTTADQ
jgi:5-hydroxyisourate hydrolase-like protein (transthyretin family)